MMTREQLFAAPKLLGRTKARLERGIAAVSAARARATEITPANRAAQTGPCQFAGTPPRQAVKSVGDLEPLSSAASDKSPGVFKALPLGG